MLERIDRPAGVYDSFSVAGAGLIGGGDHSHTTLPLVPTPAGLQAERRRPNVDDRGPMTGFGTRHRTATIDGLEVLYREAGDPSEATPLLLHGFPSSSHMFRNLMSALADDYHLVAPDHIGFGRSAMPSVNQFSYGFDRLTEITEKLLDHLGPHRFAIYVRDFLGRL